MFSRNEREKKFFDKIEIYRRSTGENSAIMKAYMGMLLDGTAFSNWQYKPTDAQRMELVRYLFLDGETIPMGFNAGKINEVKEALKHDPMYSFYKKLAEEMTISEDDFKV